jgi:Tfp pilus assembly protein PilF
MHYAVHEHHKVHDGRWLQLILFSLLLLAAACTQNPETLSREHVRRGDTYVQRGRVHEAIIDYRVAAQLTPLSGEIRKKLGQAYLSIDDAARALDELVRAADLLPNDIEAQVAAGRLLQRAGRFDDAQARARRALKLDPQSIEASLVLGSALAGVRDLDGAVAQIEEAIALNATESRAYTALGGFQLSRGRVEDAERAFQKAVELDNRSPRAHIALGYYFWSTRRVADAEAAFRKALELDPPHPLVNRILATLLLTTGRAAQAEPYLQTLAQRQPSFGLVLADYYLNRRRFRDAEQCLASLATDASMATPVALRIAGLRLAEGRVGEADETINNVLMNEPKNGAALRTKAQVLIGQNRIADAVA